MNLSKIGEMIALAKGLYDLYIEMEKDGTIQKVFDAIQAVLPELHKPVAVALIEKAKSLAPAKK